MDTIKSAPIVYFEIAGPEASALKDFYATLFGWNINADYQILPDATQTLRGGIRQDPAEKMLYIGVSDINPVLEAIQAQGGTVVIPRTVVPEVVIFALFTDPAGNRMGLVEFPKPDEAPAP